MKERKEGDFRNVQVHEINKLIDELNSQTPAQPTSDKVITITLDENDMATLGSNGITLLPAIPNTYILVKSVLLKSDCSEKFLTLTTPDYLMLQGAVNVNIGLPILGIGGRLSYIASYTPYVNVPLGVLLIESTGHDIGIVLSTYQGEDFTQGIGTLEITITYEEIEK